MSIHQSCQECNIQICLTGDDIFDRKKRSTYATCKECGNILRHKCPFCEATPTGPNFNNHIKKECSFTRDMTPFVFLRKSLGICFTEEPTKRDKEIIQILAQGVPLDKFISVDNELVSKNRFSIEPSKKRKRNDPPKLSHAFLSKTRFSIEPPKPSKKPRLAQETKFSFCKQESMKQTLQSCLLTNKTEFEQALKEMGYEFVRPTIKPCNSPIPFSTTSLGIDLFSEEEIYNHPEFSIDHFLQ